MRLSVLLLTVITTAVEADSITRVANTTLDLPGVAPANVGYEVVNAFQGQNGSLNFNNPIALATAPGDTEHVYVVQRGGQMRRVNLASKTSSAFLDLENWTDGTTQSVSTSGESGFLSAAFHPDYQENGRIFVFYTIFRNGNRYQRIAEVTKSATSSQLASHTVLIDQRDGASNHNGGDIHFGPDGYLYISVGDEGGANDGFNNGRFIDRDFFSAILRIDVDNRPGSLAPNPASSTSSIGGYRIPPDNPFVGATTHRGQPVGNVRTEIWATGLRNPFRFSFDPASGDCFVADVGQGAREEINIMASGDDGGWPEREGFIAFNNGPSAPPLPSGYQFLEPIHDYGRSVGRSITGGVVYRGSSLPEFQGSYIFADYGTGRVFELKNENNSWSRRTLLNRGNVTGFGHDPGNGDILMCILGSSGWVGRLQRSSGREDPPEFLSQTGAFSNLGNLTPQAGIYPYDVNQPFWSDNATKRRWFSIPNLNDEMTYVADSSWNFPSGQTWIKHFDLEIDGTTRKLETRFLVKTSTGAYGLSYRWFPDGSDAQLVNANGLSEQVSADQVWEFPSRASCLTCHTAETNYALSFHTRQLNRDGQLEALACAGFLDTTPADELSLPAHPALDDATVSREARVRAYLDVNCAMCHRGSESNVPGNFDARVTTQTDLAEIINGELVVGDAVTKFIVPGDLMHSNVLSKLDGSEGRMPPLASNLLDNDAIQLIRDWITIDLPARQSYAQWEVANGGTLPADGDADGDGLGNRLEYLAGTNPLEAGSKFSLNLTPEQVSFMAPANRRLILEMSPNLINWSPLEVAGNTNAIPAAAEMKSLPLPDLPDVFLRARFEEP